MEELRKFPNLFMERKGKKTSYFIKTKLNKAFFEEKIIKLNGDYYKEVDPERSKLFASIAKDISQLGIKTNSTILYLGASHGYTVSFLSDMVEDGEIYALDFAPRVVRDLVFLCEVKENIAPIMDDAFHPERYVDFVPKVDIVFMDIAQKNQVEIFVKNCDIFLKEGGFGLLALKARSVDVTKSPREIFKLTRAQLESVMTVVDYRELEPFEKDHAFFVCKRKDDKKIDLEKIKNVKVVETKSDTFQRRDNNFRNEKGKNNFQKKNYSGNSRSFSRRR
ncbi:MAG: fibrillarin-like rRNA/tRNA 2'-O-methyltransferase [Candidatus Woesearchaeota archaeon]